MSRIYVGGGGLALFVGAVIGLFVGKGSWFLAVIGLVAFLWAITLFWRKYSAARNALLAKHTWDALEDERLRGQVIAKAREVSGMSTLEMTATLSPPQEYGTYAVVMASLGIPPSLPGERWFAVSDPLRAIRNAEPEIASAKNYFRKKHGISIDFDD